MASKKNIDIVTNEILVYVLAIYDESTKIVVEPKKVQGKKLYKLVVRTQLYTCSGKCYKSSRSCKYGSIFFFELQCRTKTNHYKYMFIYY
jgi:hypothetical protein